MDRNIEFQLLGIATVLQRYRLRVPPNQREYSWQKEHVLDLLQDISKAMRAVGEAYFLGTIVLTKTGREQLEVADGQQRLATTTMILAAIRDWYLARNDEIGVESIETDFLSDIDLEARERVPKLVLNTDDNAYFKNSVLDRPGKRAEVRQSRRSHRLISEAKGVIAEYLANAERQAGVANFRSVLDDWVRYLKSDASVIALTVGDSKDAFVMFETLNDRGLKTSQVDLVKNFLFREAGEERLVEAQNQWSSMRGAIETVGEDDLTMEYLKLACCLLTGHTREKDVLERITSEAVSRTETLRLLHFLAELSSDYSAILNADHPKWNDYDIDTRKSIRTIIGLGISQIRPLMLAVARHFTPNQTTTSFRRMIAWSVRFLIVGGRGGKLDEGYAKLANDIHKGRIRSADALVEASVGFVPTDAQFKSSFEVARVSISALARYYLRTLEETARQQPDPEWKPNDEIAINLEHVMPQKHSDQWACVSQQDVETHAKRLGNMALLQAAKNSELDRSEFEKKRAVYRTSTFLLTAQIADLPTWGVQQIEARQRTLAELAVKTWPIN